MEYWRENLSVISKLKIAENQTEALAARLYFERLFSAANFHPPEISQKAIVCIKKINAPPIKNNRFISSAVEWENGVRAEVEKLFRRALRPIRDTVPAQAESIVFEDKSEMLACLARDWKRGILIENWWWRGLFPKLFRAQTVAEIWLDAAEFAPAALQILSKNNDAKDFVKKLQPLETIVLLKKIIRIFGLNKLEKALFEAIEEKVGFDAAKLIKADENVGFQTDKNILISTETDSFFINPLHGLKTADLSFEGRCLLETALLLARSPRIARSPEFAERVKINRIKNEFRKFAAGGKSERRIEKNKRFEKSEFQTNQPKRAKNEPGFIKPKIKTSENPQIESKKLPESTDKSSIKTKKIGFETAEPEKEVKKNERKLKGKREKFNKTKAAKQIGENFFEDFESAVEFSFQTRFGGVFYLLNLGLFLGLYRDFTESLETEINLNIWDFTALLGFEFLGEQIKTDAVWDFLKLVAERENDDEFGREFDQVQDWRMPPEWLETFPKNRKWICGKNGGRLIIRHPEGFNTVDILRRGDFETQLANELENYQKYYSEIEKTGRKHWREIKSKKWLKNLAEYMQKRLFLALNLKNFEELNTILFERKASVLLSATQLEITFSLTDLPIEIRLAGIDRNPGWIPAAGKFVYFHFV